MIRVRVRVRVRILDLGRRTIGQRSESLKIIVNQLN